MIRWPALIAPVLALALSLPVDAAASERWRQPDSPFALGEAYPDEPASCETLEGWIDDAPDIADRVSLAIEGVLTSAESDGALAYLVMCDPSAVQIMCVTYELDGMTAGDRVLFAGGYQRYGPRRVMLDPCLASEVDG